MSREYGLHGSQPSLSTGKRRLNSGGTRFAATDHCFGCRDKAGSVTGNLLDCGQRPTREAPDVILVPDRKMIADEQGQYAHCHPIACFFEHHKTLLFRLLRPLCQLDVASRNSLSHDVNVMYDHLLGRTPDKNSRADAAETREAARPALHLKSNASEAKAAEPKFL
jgi:hypothetical protein